MAVRTRGKIIYIDFYCFLPDGRKVRCVESTGLSDTQRNMKVAEDKNKAIQYELKHGHFDYLHFFPRGSKANFFRRPVKDMVFSAWWDQWISEKSLRLNTEKGLNSAYEKYIGPYFGHYPISRISEHDLLVFRKLLQERHNLKASSINHKIMKPLCSALLKAHTRQLIDNYPCSGIKRLEEDLVDIDPFTPEELTHLLQVLKEKKRFDDYDLIYVWSRTGLRPGEIYALKWSHIDYYNKKLMVRETRLPNGSEGPPKTPHSVRDVDLRPPVSEVLRRQEARTGLVDRYVFMTHASKPFSDAFMRKRFRHILRLAGLKYRPPKQMRHTFATLHIAAKENISWVSRMLGHASVETTLKRYNRFVPNLTHDDGSLFEKLMDELGEKGNNQVTISGK